ncbi:MAG: chalcone isomerase family protein [Piscinibacter sp.]
MNPTHWTRLALALALYAPAAAMAADLAGVRLTDTAPVGGRLLRLSGAAVATRALVLRLYVIALYLPEARAAAPADPLNSDGPRRLVITLLRDVCGQDFIEVVQKAADSRGPQRERFADYAARLGAALSRRDCALRRGDTLAFDWLPGHGAVPRLNGAPLLEPEPDAGIYAALLRIWLGDEPVDAALKADLLGARS